MKGDLASWPAGQAIFELHMLRHFNEPSWTSKGCNILTYHAQTNINLPAQVQNPRSPVVPFALQLDGRHNLKLKISRFFVEIGEDPDQNTRNTGSLIMKEYTMAMFWLDHVNIRTAKLDEMSAFYEDVLGLPRGKRPSFPMGGAWKPARNSRPKKPRSNISRCVQTVR